MKRHIAYFLAFLLLASPAFAASTSYPATLGSGAGFAAWCVGGTGPSCSGGAFWPATVIANSSGTELFTSANPGYVQVPSGGIASGAVASGAYASGAFASGAAASGSWADGAIATLGTKADTACSTAPCTTNGWLAGLPADLALPPNLLTATTYAGCPTVTTGNNPWCGDGKSTPYVDIGAIGTAAVLVGAGATGTGSQRVTVAEDTNTVAGSASIPAGTNLIGKFGIDQTTPGTTNGISIVGVNGATALGGTGAVGAGAQRVAVGTDTATVAGTAPVKASVPIIDGANTYNTIAASTSAYVLSSTQGGGTGTTGDYLSHCTVIPTTTSPGVVTILDNSTTIYAFPGGPSTLSNLVPFSIPIGALSTSGAWKITTGAGLSMVCVGKFT